MNQAQEVASQSRLVASLVLTGAFAIVEATGGLLGNSLGLLGDSGHMFTDFSAILFALVALRVGRRRHTISLTYGYHRSEILAALGNGLALAALSFYLFYEAYMRFLSPPPVRGSILLPVGLAGLVANITVVWLLRENRGNLNVRGAYLHAFSDTISSVGVVVGGVIVVTQGLFIADTLVGAFIGALILRSSARLVRDSAHILMEGVPPHLDARQVTHELKGIPGVRDLHDLHIWSITSGIHALSGHVLVDDQMLTRASSLIRDIENRLREKFNITHVTIQLEPFQVTSIERADPI